MKSLIQLCWVIGLQFIACRLAEWPLPETLFMLSVVLLWSGLFLWIFNKIKTTSKNKSTEHNKVFWYLLMPLASLFSPLVTLSVFIIGTINEIRKFSGCRSMRSWFKSQVVDPSSGTSGDIEFQHVDFEDVNYNNSTNYPLGWKK
ncbi:entry exclusion protein [Salmonella enterica]|nr:entry exclusion protein [Salmonella enterica subsp. enterica serovar Javiana]EGB2808603.1 entry exclusion protein [Salmonella enterica]EKB7612309.1 entry exclusion protein [Salmonella enterica]